MITAILPLLPLFLSGATPADDLVLLFFIVLIDLLLGGLGSRCSFLLLNAPLTIYLLKIGLAHNGLVILQKFGFQGDFLTFDHPVSNGLAWAQTVDCVGAYILFELIPLRERHLLVLGLDFAFFLLYVAKLF